MPAITCKREEKTTRSLTFKSDSDNILPMPRHTVFLLWIDLIITCATVAAQVPKQFRPEVLKDKQGFQWRERHSARIDFYFESGSPAERDIAKIDSNLEQSYSHILQLLGSGPANFRLQSFIVDSRTRMKQLCGRESNGLAVGSVFLFVYGEPVKAWGPHEPCHLLSQHFWATPHGIWLTEGLAVYSGDEWQGHPLHSVCKQLRAQGKLVPITELFDETKWSQLSEMVSYPEAGSFIKFLYEKYGMSDVRAIWTTGAKGIPQVFGKSAEQLQAEWLAVIDGSESGEFAYKFN